MPKPYKSPLERKLRYVDNLASREGVELSMLRWEARIPEIEFAIGFNVAFKYLLDIFLSFNLHFEIPELDFELPDFRLYFQDLLTGLSFLQLDLIEKAKYGESRYGKSIYDPEQVSSKPLDRLLWDLRYKSTERDDLAYKHTSNALLNWIQELKEKLLEREVLDEYTQGMLYVLSVVEGKMISSGYFGFSVFDGAVFVDGDKFTVRSTDDWKSEIEFETLGVYESHFDATQFDYARWGDTYEEGTIVVDPTLEEELDRRIKEFQQRSGLVEQYGEKTIYQRVFFHQKEDQMHVHGGHHQIILQNLKNEVKRLLNQRGVIAQFRGAYYAFAQELYYMYYEPHRKYKQWKNILNDEDLISKYRRMGCDESILREILGVFKGWWKT